MISGHITIIISRSAYNNFFPACDTFLTSECKVGDLDGMYQVVSCFLVDRFDNALSNP